MGPAYEVVHLVDGHLFDAECYELTSVRGPFSQRQSGYYVVARAAHDQEWRDDEGLGFGPFVTAIHAILVMRELQQGIGATEDEPYGPPVDATGVHDLELEPWLQVGPQAA